VTPPPPPLTVARLVDDDAIDPGPKARLPAETRERAEDAKEYLLREVQRLIAILQQVQCQRVNHALVDGHQVGARDLVTGGTALDERRLQPIAPAFFTRPPEMGVCMKCNTVL
jgi:hypothetical protein